MNFNPERCEVILPFAGQGPTEQHHHTAPDQRPAFLCNAHGRWQQQLLHEIRTIHSDQPKGLSNFKQRRNPVAAHWNCDVHERMGNCDSLVIANTMPRESLSMDTNKTFKNHGITDYQGQQKIRECVHDCNSRRDRLQKCNARRNPEENLTALHNATAQACSTIDLW